MSAPESLYALFWEPVWQTFPDWAPKELVAFYRERIGIPAYADRAMVAYKRSRQILKQFGIASAESFEDYAVRYYRDLAELPGDEGLEVLCRLLTDQNMRSVWLSVARNAPEGFSYMRYWDAIEEAILSWKGHSRRTPKEHREHLLQIAELAVRLGELIQDTQELRGLSPSDAASEKPRSSGLTRPAAPTRLGSGKLQGWLYLDHGPSDHTVSDVLLGLRRKVLLILEETPLAKEPNSEDAAIQYFVRYFGQRVDQMFGHPLHQVVADTASVVFDRYVDKDRVRYLRRTSQKRSK